MLVNNNLMLSYGGANFFVSSGGTGDGRSAATPMSQADFLTLTLNPKDRVAFKRGDTFTIAEYNVPAHQLTFGAYGSGADPVFSGATSLSGATWTNEGSGFYSTPLGTAPLWVFVDGEAARQGESPWIAISSAPSGTSRGGPTGTLNTYNSVESLVGAKLRVKEFEFRLSFEMNITGYDTGTGVLTTTETFVGAGVGMPFKLYGQKQFCTVQNDWYWDGTKLWVYKSTSPSGTDIAVTYENNALIVDTKNNITIRGIEFKNYYKEAILTELSHDLVIDDCNIHDIRTNGIRGLLASDNAIIQNNTITNCGFNGISFGTWQNFSILNNTISYIGEQDNLGWPIEAYPYGTSGCAIFSGWEAGAIPIGGYVYRNTLSNLGYQGYMICGDDHVAEENFIDTYCTRWTDGGAFHAFHRSDLGPSTKNITIRKNIILNGIGNLDGVTSGAINRIAGIYIDNGTKESFIDGNTVIDGGRNAIFLNAGIRAISITGNTLYKATRALLNIYQNAMADADHFDDAINMICTDNVFIVSRLDNYAVVLEDNYGSSTFNPFTSSDNNSYISPYKTTLNGYTTNTDGTITTQTFAQWQTKLSMDASSNVIANTLVTTNTLIRDALDMLVDYNASGSNEASTIGSGYVDRFNSAIAGATILPYESVAYINTVQVGYLVDLFGSAGGTNISGRAPDVGPTPTVVSGAHTTNGSGSMVSSSNGLVSWNVGVSDYVLESFTSISNTSSTMRHDVRLQDDAGSANNRIILDFTGGNIRLREFYASATATQTLTAAFTTATSTLYNIRVYCSGATINVYVDGTLYLTMTTSLTTGTRVGNFGDTVRSTLTLLCYDDNILIP